MRTLLALSLVAVMALPVISHAQPQIQPQQPRTQPPPPPPPPQASTPGVALNEPMWIAVNGQTTGPFEPNAIVQKIAAREIIGETLVFTNSMNRWVRASDVAALQPLLRQAQAGAPQPGIPPTPPAGDNEQIARLTQFMVGEWMTETPGMYQGITVRMQTRYFPDGTFRGYSTLIAAMGGGPSGTQTRPHNGRFTIQPIDDRRFVLTLTGAQLAGSTAMEILDQNRLRNEQDNYTAVRIGR